MGQRIPILVKPSMSFIFEATAVNQNLNKSSDEKNSFTKFQVMLLDMYAQKPNQQSALLRCVWKGSCARK